MEESKKVWLEANDTLPYYFFALACGFTIAVRLILVIWSILPKPLLAVNRVVM
jgi:hypothetical protein